MNSVLYSIVNRLEYYINLKLVQVRASSVLIEMFLRLILFVLALAFKLIKHVLRIPAATTPNRAKSSARSDSQMQNDAVEKNLNESSHSTSHSPQDTTSFEVANNVTSYSSPITIETTSNDLYQSPSSISPVYSTAGSTISFESEQQESLAHSSSSSEADKLKQVEFDLNNESLDVLIRKLIFKYYETKSFNPNLSYQVSSFNRDFFLFLRL